MIWQGLYIVQQSLKGRYNKCGRRIAVTLAFQSPPHVVRLLYNKRCYKIHSVSYFRSLKPSRDYHRIWAITPDIPHIHLWRTLNWSTEMHLSSFCKDTIHNTTLSQSHTNKEEQSRALIVQGNMRQHQKVNSRLPRPPRHGLRNLLLCATDSGHGD